MKSPKEVRSQHKGARKEIALLMKKKYKDGLLPHELGLLLRLEAIRKTLEWVHPLLIKPKIKGPDRFNDVLAEKHWRLGPVFAEMYP